MIPISTTERQGQIFTALDFSKCYLILKQATLTAVSYTHLMVNMLISSAIVRKREFALLQAVGMTNQQLRKMLYREGMSISVKLSLIHI